VSDADSWTETENPCDKAQSYMQAKENYKKYNITLSIVQNRKYTCFSNYGTADYYHRREQLLSPKPYAYWTSTCVITVGACKFMVGLASGGVTAGLQAVSGWKDYAACLVTPGTAFAVNQVLVYFNREPSRIPATLLAPAQLVDASRAFVTNYTIRT
jgi:hypothetical protein